MATFASDAFVDANGAKVKRSSGHYQASCPQGTCTMLVVSL